MPAETRLEPRQGGLRVLVLDDNRDAADSLGQLVQIWGHQAFVAYDGPAALELARRCRPDVALLDLVLRTMTGYEVAERLRRQPESKDVVLIAVTGRGDAQARRRACVAGFAQHLLKPVAPELLQRVLAAMHERLVGTPRPVRPAKGTGRMPLPGKRRDSS